MTDSHMQPLENSTLMPSFNLKMTHDGYIFNSVELTIRGEFYNPVKSYFISHKHTYPGL